MATGTPNLNTPPPAPGADPQFEAVVERQLREARLHVKLTDIAATLMIWLAGLIVFLLTAAVIDSYVFDLGVTGRIVALIVLVAASLWYFVATLLPMVMGKLNPVYVASIIEESQPSLKNSLMNFLLLRGDPRGVHNAIFSALRRQAATAVSQVNASAAVDRSKVIKTGYVLATAVAVFAIYTVLQPNPLAPLETMRRIFAPLSAIDRPTRVQITNIQPGDASVLRGESVTVSAVVHHLGENQQVKLFYSTVDNVTVDRMAEMLLDEKSGEHRVLLEQTDEGLQQSLTYRIEAGDAVSALHQLTVIDRPAIWVQSLDYNYPPQAGLKNRVESPPANGGDIAGIEGTHVTIKAAANMDIATAYLEFEPTADRPARKLPMQHEGRNAFVKLPLQTNAKRDGPLYSGYRVRFSTADGKRNETSGHPHKIEVTPDMAPEVEVLHPVNDPYELRANGTVEIEIRAVDVDFGLRQIILQAELVERDGARLHPATDTRAAKGGLINKVLFEHATGAVGKQIATHRFDATALRLQAGDIVSYRAVAIDNRTAPIDRAAAPNRSATDTFQIQITASGKGTADNPTSDTNKPSENPSKSAGDSAKPEGGSDEGEPGDKTEEPKDSENPEDGEAGDESSESSEGESSDGKSSDTESSDGESTDSDSSDGETAGSESEGGSDGESDGEKQGSESKAGGEGSGSEQADDSSSDAEKQSGGSGATSGGGEKSSDANQSSESGGDDMADGDGKSTGKPADGSSGGKPGEGSPSGEPGEASADDQQEPLHDGEVFERALEHLKQQQKQNGKSAGQQDSISEPDANGQPQNEPLDGGTADSKGNASSDAKSSQDPGQKPQPGDGSKPSPPEGNQPDGDASQQPQDGAGQKPQDAGKENEGSPKSDAGSGETPQGNPGKQPQEGGADSKGSGDKKGGMDQKDGKGSPQGEGEKPGKKDGSDDSGSKSGSDSQSASQSQKASSTKGDDGGDRSGAGKKGGGQGSDNPGQGKAGGSTPSDTGAGAANEPGKGETSDQAGGEKPGQASDGEGGDGDSGSKQKGGDQAGQDAGDKQGTGEAAGDQKASPQNPADQPGDKQQPAKPEDAQDSSQETPSGEPGESTPPENPGAKPGKNGGADSPFGGSGGMADTPIGENAEGGNMPPGDKANMEYARKATDLALEHLRKNSRKPDKELLDKLNMSPEELQAFVDRWQKMKSSSTEDPSAGKAELDDSLRSLGLTPSTGRARTAGARDDAVKGIRDAGSRTAPPAGFLKKFKAFQKSVARGE